MNKNYFGNLTKNIGMCLIGAGSMLYSIDSNAQKTSDSNTKIFVKGSCTYDDVDEIISKPGDKEKYYLFSFKLQLTSGKRITLGIKGNKRMIDGIDSLIDERTPVEMYVNRDYWDRLMKSNQSIMDQAFISDFIKIGKLEKKDIDAFFRNYK